MTPDSLTVTDALRQAAEALIPVSDSPRLDAELLMAHALGVSRSEMLLRHMRDAAPAGFAALLSRRKGHEPVAYILGKQEFYGLDFAVSPVVLIPRADSETLIEAARQAFADRAPHRIIDLGTGSGALLLAALSLWPEAEGVGIDRSADALAVASGNARQLGLADRASFLQADWTQDGWSGGLGRFDLLLANPPYVETAAELAPQVREFEPAGALFAGAEGLDDYRVLIPQISGLLNPHGVALVEIGAAQDAPVTALAVAAGLSARLHRDLGNRPRALELVAFHNISLGKRPGDH